MKGFTYIFEGGAVVGFDLKKSNSTFSSCVINSTRTDDAWREKPLFAQTGGSLEIIDTTISHFAFESLSSASLTFLTGNSPYAYLSNVSYHDLEKVSGGAILSTSSDVAGAVHIFVDACIVTESYYPVMGGGLFQCTSTIGDGQIIFNKCDFPGHYHVSGGAIFSQQHLTGNLEKDTSYPFIAFPVLPPTAEPKDGWITPVSFDLNNNVSQFYTSYMTCPHHHHHHHKEEPTEKPAEEVKPFPKVPKLPFKRRPIPGLEGEESEMEEFHPSPDQTPGYTTTVPEVTHQMPEEWKDRRRHRKDPKKIVGGGFNALKPKLSRAVLTDFRPAILTIQVPNKIVDSADRPFFDEETRAKREEEAQSICGQFDGPVLHLQSPCYPVARQTKALQGEIVITDHERIINPIFKDKHMEHPKNTTKGKKPIQPRHSRFVTVTAAEEPEPMPNSLQHVYIKFTEEHKPRDQWKKRSEEHHHDQDHPHPRPMAHSIEIIHQKPIAMKVMKPE